MDLPRLLYNLYCDYVKSVGITIYCYLFMINKKKSITLRNRTNYFNPDTTRVKVHFSSPDSYQSRQQKIEGYENRLY